MTRSVREATRMPLCAPFGRECAVREAERTFSTATEAMSKTSLAADWGAEKPKPRPFSAAPWAVAPNAWKLVLPCEYSPDPKEKVPVAAPCPLRLATMEHCRARASLSRFCLA